MTTDWRAVFESTYRVPSSLVQERIWREAFGDEYPEGVDPYSYITRSELERFVRELRLEPGDRLVDVGCGRGGPGLFVAAATGARLTGLDIAESALAGARERASAMGFAAEFRTGEFEATGLPHAFADGVMSIDALLFTQSKPAALAELRRILKPDARLIFTTWDYHTQPSNRPPQVPDHRPILEGAGFDVVAYETTDRWRAYAEATNAGLLAGVEELAAESGDPPDLVRADVLEMVATYRSMSRRILVVATAS